MKTIDVLAAGVTAHKLDSGEYVIFYDDADGSGRVAFGWPAEPDLTLKRVRGTKKPAPTDPDMFWRLEPIGEVVYAHGLMTEAQYTLRSFVPDEMSRRSCAWRDETAVRDVLACDLKALDANRAQVSSMIPTACCDSCRVGLRAMASAYKKYSASVRRNDRDKTRWMRCAELCWHVGDRAGEAVALRRANKIAALAESRTKAVPPPLPSMPSHPMPTSVPRSAMSAAAKKHAAALKKHGEGSRQETRARREMLEFDAILTAA